MHRSTAKAPPHPQGGALIPYYYRTPYCKRFPLYSSFVPALRVDQIMIKKEVYS
jgi:hypothetical protein